MRENKVLHISKDEKFIDAAYKWAEKTAPGLCKFLIISDTNDLKYIKETPVEIVRRKKLFRDSFIKKLKDYDAIIIHNLNLYKIWLVLIAPKEVNFVWIGLGVDYYRYIFKSREEMYLPLTKKLFRKKTSFARNYLKQLFYNNYVVKRGINKFRFFAPVIANDYKLLKSKNEWFKPTYIDFNYGSGIQKINKCLEKKVTLGRSILVGNSASYANNHLDFFEQIKDFSLEDRPIICPLNYGREEYKKEILLRGKNFFKDKFNGLTDYLSFPDYTKLLESCSIVVMNHKRQQALGNIHILLSMGAKIYLRKENPVYNYLSDHGFKIFAIEEIESEQDFLKTLGQESIKKNKKVTRNLFSEEKFKKKISYFYSAVVK